MFFQIDVTPESRKASQVRKNEESNGIYTLVLAPFQPPTHIKVEAKIESEAKCQLIIKNAGNKPLTVSVNKKPPEERGFCLMGEEWTIQPDDFASLQMIWKPREFGVWRDTLQFIDNRKIKHDVCLILTCPHPKLPKGTRVKRIAKSANSKNLNIKPRSPPIKRYRSKENVTDKENKPGFNWMIEQARAKRHKQEQTPTSDFSRVLNSESFMLTPVGIASRKSSKILQINQSENILVTPKFSKTHESDMWGVKESIRVETRLETRLRKETYLTVPTFLTNQESLHPSNSIEEEKRFEDSLSPKREKIPSDFSIMLNDIQFTPIKPQQISNEKRSSDVKNTTFDIESPDSPIKAQANSTFEIPESPLELEKPECSTLALHRNDSVKHVVEADMWVRPKRDTISPIFNSTLQSIIEEEPDLREVNNPQSNKLLRQKAVCIEISPPKKYLVPTRTPPAKKLSPKLFRTGKVTKEKHVREVTSLKKKIQSNNSIINSVHIPNVIIPKLSLVKLHKSNHKPQKEVSIEIYKPNNEMYWFYNPDPFAATTTRDPFLSSSVLCDENWMANQELQFQKWLNALLTPPEDLSVDVESASIDIAKIWQSCKSKENFSLAETKESVSSRYHTDMRLNSLRKAAVMMYQKKEVAFPLSQVATVIEKGLLVVRKDRDLHKDIGLQKIILELLLSYNPLWLRIGLETIYGEVIPLKSNDDLTGLTRFLLNRFFSDPKLVKANSCSSSQNIRLPNFQPQMNKFILKKFLFLVFFLDYAKIHTLIRHDPCLFHKKALYKDSREVLLTFSREVLSGIGDITKLLRNYKYTISHKQTYLDEYDYAVSNLINDLRDGVRLCRIMELVTNKRCLTCRCRVPAISRLQRIHNVGVALSSLLDSGYELSGNIDAKSIADGYREKILSLLWQIIHKVQAPRFGKSAKIIQKWWRAKLWYIRLRFWLRNRRDIAASTIQRAWKCHLARRKREQLRLERAEKLKTQNEAASKLQSYWRGHKETRRKQREFKSFKTLVLRIQKWWRRIASTKNHIQELKHKKEMVLLIQRKWRAHKMMQLERKKFLETKESVNLIAMYWRARKIRIEYLKLKEAVIFVQRTWRTKKRARIELKAAEVLQKWWKRYVLFKKDRSLYLELRDTYRETKRNDSAAVIQACWRNHRMTKPEIERLKQKKESILKIQSWWKMILCVNRYKTLRSGCILIQRTWRKHMLERSREKAALTIQRNWKMREAKSKFSKLKTAVLTIENWYLAKITRRTYLRKKTSVLRIEIWWQFTKLAIQHKKKYRDLRKATMIFQQQWRSQKIMRTIRAEYLLKRNSAIKIQSWWRKRKHDRRHRAAVILQNHWLALKAGRRARHQYLAKKSATIKIQKRWRATLLFRTRQRAAVAIQKNWRSLLARRKFEKKKDAVRTIENWRSNILVGRKIREDYLCLKSKAIFIQRLWRARRDRVAFLSKIKAATKIQRCFRWYYMAKMRLRAAVVLQRRYRANRAAFEVCRSYRDLKKRVVKIQKWWRAILNERNLAQKRAMMRWAVEVIENWWINLKEKQIEKRRREEAAIKIQAIWRGYKVRLSAGKRLTELRKRVKKASEEAVESNTLEFRLKESVDIFIGAGNIGQLSVCLASLDIITRLSPNACIHVCQYNLVSKLYDILAKANQSLPWLDVCLKDVSILLSLAKYSPSTPYVKMEDHIEVLARFLKISIDKKVELFLHTATLFWILIEDEKYAEAARSCSQSRYMLTTLLSNKIWKLSMNKSKSKPELLPSPKPDWGLKHKRPRTFENIPQAINAIAKRMKMRQVPN